MKKVTYGLIGAGLWGFFISGVTPDLFWGRTVGYGIIGLFAVLALAKSISMGSKSDNKPESQSSLEDLR
jgi:hypothetical protein